MHELSLAQNILEIAEDALKKNHANSVSQIVLEIGILSGVEILALKTALDIIKTDTFLSQALIIFNEVPGKARCRICQHEFDVGNLFTPCPQCNAYNSQIIAGQELIVKRIIAE